MPADATRNTLLRQWELLKRLPSRGAGKSADELAKDLNASGFRVSKRQVERDLNALAESFPLDCNNKSKPYGWRWADDASANLPGMTLAEALSLRVIEDALRPLLPVAVLKAVEPRFVQARKKLAGMTINPVATWANKVRSVLPALPLLPPQIADGVLEPLQEALLADERIEVRYQTRGRTRATQRVLTPLGLVQRGPVCYLVATENEYTEPRLYAAHRMRAVRRLHQAATRPDGFDLDTYIAQGALQFGGIETIRLIARVSAGLANILDETPLCADQVLERTPEGGRLSATVVDSPQLVWWLQGQGADIEVLQPPTLRARIADGLTRALAPYRTDNGPGNLSGGKVDDETV